MTEERLKEIKDSIDFQKEYTIYKGFDMELLQEEIDLYEEVIKLRERIEKVIEYINIIDNRSFINIEEVRYIKDILKGEDNESEAR